ncbi:MAG: cyclic nucleotide-binding domain-containing protein [Chloroflexi bacterium]|nr:cyclic nucleotide-binding domain-containing protein [Chloroflexota bacterium]
MIRNQLLFVGLSQQEIDWLAQMAEEISLKKGEVLMEEGTPGDALYLVVEGTLEVTKRSGNSEVVLAMRGVGEVFGEMSLLEPGGLHSATVHAVNDSKLFKISKTVFDELLTKHPAATLAILRTVMTRLRNTEAMMKQNEKMASLGTLAAGLAHELNNPAAAARRSSAQMRDILIAWQQLTMQIGILGLDVQQIQTLNRLRDEMIKRSANQPALDPITRSDLESDLQAWLEDHNVPDAWDVAPTLVSCGWKITDLQNLSVGLSDAQFPSVVRWLCVGCSTFSLLDEVTKSAERISEIVKAVKSYSYLDQAPVQSIEVHEGIENTLTILRSRLKQGVTIKRNYGTDLPRIDAYGSELNQVWTNIIDNAIDAMQGRGIITIKTRRNGDERIMIEITDNGPGIPPEIQPRVFDPFFTTKPPGVGTGLGLNITYNIVQKHRGDISVSSKPGETTFRVELPIQLKT